MVLQVYKGCAFETLNAMLPLPFGLVRLRRLQSNPPCSLWLQFVHWTTCFTRRARLLEHSTFSFYLHIARRGEVGTRIDRYRSLIMSPRFVRQAVANNMAQSLVQPSSSALISAFALRTLTPNKHNPCISTPAQASG